MNVKRYLINLFKIANRLFNTLTGGDPEEPSSSRWGRLRDRHAWARFLCEALNKIEFWRDVDHCAGAYDPFDGFRASDPDGKWFLPLAAFWLGMFGYLIWLHIP